MADKSMKKRLKTIRKEIMRLQKEYKRMEFLPCQSDAELREKDERLKEIMAEIYFLEKEQDRYILDSGRISHGS